MGIRSEGLVRQVRWTFDVQVGEGWNTVPPGQIRIDRPQIRFSVGRSQVISNGPPSDLIE
jgi:hypothetical protein